MQPEATFITAYAAALLTATLGIHKLGRANLSRTANQSESDAVGPRCDDWPQSEVPRFYTRISLAASAAALLPGAELVARNNSLLETAALIVVVVAAQHQLARDQHRHRSAGVFARDPEPVGNRSPACLEPGRSWYDDQHGENRGDNAGYLRSHLVDDVTGDRPQSLPLGGSLERPIGFPVCRPLAAAVESMAPGRRGSSLLSAPPHCSSRREAASCRG